MKWGKFLPSALLVALLTVWLALFTRGTQSFQHTVVLKLYTIAALVAISNWK